MDKLLAMYVAAQLAHASAGNATPGSNLPISPEISDPSVRAKNLMVWEDFRIFYHAVVKALADDNPDTGWPAPKLNPTNLLNLDQLAPLLRGLLPGAVTPTP